MRPRSYQVIGDVFVIVWEDGRESYYPLERLRRECPCAACSGEPDLFGRMAGGGPQRYGPNSFELAGVEPVGNYALQLNWADGHSYGIWTYERLLEVSERER